MKCFFRETGWPQGSVMQYSAFHLSPMNPSQTEFGKWPITLAIPGAAWWPVWNEEGHLCVCLLEGKYQLHHKKGTQLLLIITQFNILKPRKWAQKTQPSSYPMMVVPVSQGLKNINEDSCIVANQTVPLQQTGNPSLTYSQQRVIAILPRSMWKCPGRMVWGLGATSREAWPWSYRKLQTSANLHLGSKIDPGNLLRDTASSTDRVNMLRQPSLEGSVPSPIMNILFWLPK